MITAPAYETTNNPEASFEIFARLRVESGENGPDTVTQALGLFPSHVCRKGEPKQPVGQDSWAATDTPCHRHNVWILESGLKPRDTELELHIDALLEQLEGKEAVLNNWAGRSYFSIAAYAHDHVPALTLTPEQMRRMAALGVTLDIDLYDWTKLEHNDN